MALCVTICNGDISLVIPKFISEYLCSDGFIECSVYISPVCVRDSSKVCTNCTTYKLLVRSKLVFTGIAVNGGSIRILLNTWKQKLFEFLLWKAPWDMYKCQCFYLGNVCLLLSLQQNCLFCSRHCADFRLQYSVCTVWLPQSTISTHVIALCSLLKREIKTHYCNTHVYIYICVE